MLKIIHIANAVAEWLVLLVMGSGLHVASEFYARIWRQFSSENRLLIVNTNHLTTFKTTFVVVTKEPSLALQYVKRSVPVIFVIYIFYCQYVLLKITFFT